MPRAFPDGCEVRLPSTSMPDFADETFMTVAEVAAALRMNPQTIRNWIDAGQLPAVRIGRRVRILSSDFATLIANDVRRPATGALDSSHDVRAQQFWDGEWIPEIALS
jgi:excisionase family DNA binding protein